MGGREREGRRVLREAKRVWGQKRAREGSGGEGGHPRNPGPWKRVVILFKNRLGLLGERWCGGVARRMDGLSVGGVQKGEGQN